MRYPQAAACTASIAFAIAAAAAQADGGPNHKPGVIQGEIRTAAYDGNTDDLLTAGLGAAGIQGAAPAFADPLNPTAAELRRRAIYNNYRALVNVTSNGGYGTFYGPDVGLDAAKLPNDGKVAGEEYLAFAGDGSGKENVSLMVQVPASFDPKNPCIVTGASSGSRGIYGAIGTSGDWGLKRGCAVAYTDKGTGTGAHDLQNDRVNLIDGLVVSAADAGKDSIFTAKLSPAELALFNVATPNRFSFKHAHSRRNPEQDWGRHVLWSVEFAFYVLNEKFGDRNNRGHAIRPIITPRNTIVIASSVSNGAGAALAAAEQDRHGLIDGVAVSEPQIQTALPRGLVIERGGVPVAAQGLPLYDYATIANLFQPCAARGLPDSPLSLAANAVAANRCASLRAKGLITGDDVAAQASDALAKLLAAGWEPESNLLHASHYSLATPAIAVTYANAYDRASVTDNLCGFSFGATDPATFGPVPLAAGAAAQIFANSNGIPPTVGVNLINNNSVGGPRLDGASVSPSTGALDFNVDGALCLRGLWTGTNPATGAKLTGEALAEAMQLRNGVRQVLVEADLRGKPAILVQGRADTLVPVNHASRAWYGANRMEEKRSNARYYEVTNAQHFDAFLPLSGYDTRFVPLHVYFNRALNLMYDHLKNGTPLPPSQVVRTTPRGGTSPAPALQAVNVPDIAATPAAADRITFGNRTLRVPD